MSAVVQLAQSSALDAKALGGEAFSDTACSRVAEPAVHRLQIWLIREPGHYKVVYPAEVCKDIEPLKDAGVHLGC